MIGITTSNKILNKIMNHSNKMNTLKNKTKYTLKVGITDSNNNTINK